MGPENDDSIDSNTSKLARICAQIKQRIRLDKCVHPEKSLIFVLSLDGAQWVEYCTDCDKVTDRESNYS